MNNDIEERKALAMEIRDMRTVRKWTQQQLADAAGVSLGTVKNLEGAKTELQPGKLGAVLDALGMKRDALPWAGDRDFEAFMMFVGLRVWNKQPAKRAELMGRITTLCYAFQ